MRYNDKSIIFAQTGYTIAMKTLVHMHLTIKKIILLMGICCSLVNIFAQTPTLKDRDVKLQKASNLLEKHRFSEALSLSKSLLANYSQDAEVHLLIGLAYVNIGNMPDSAIFFFSKGVELSKSNPNDTETSLNLHMSLGKAYQQALKPQDALDVYARILNGYSDIDLALKEEIAHEIQTCENSKLFLQNPIALKINNLGKNINSEYDEHTPLVSVSNNQLVFTSRRKQDNLSLLEDGQYPEKICRSKSVDDQQWESSKLLKTFYKKQEHESAVSLSPDGKQMFLFKNDIDGKNLYVSTLKASEWSTPSKLPEPINSYSQETHCSLSADGSTLFFTSDREGGYGGLDIYMCKKQPNGMWGNARNLGPAINTPFNEETPMVYLDGKTLYFASEGHNSMGMFDIFYSQMLPDSTWNSPINLGYPINTPGDDMFFVPTIERNRAYYASSQFADNIGGLDIYLIEFDPQFKGKLAVVEGKVTQSGKEKIIRILVSRASDQQLVGDYRPDPVNGEYTMFLETGHRYQIKQVKQITVDEELGDIEVGDEMAYENLKTPVKMYDLKIVPPLVPAERLLAKTIPPNSVSTEVVPPAASLVTLPTNLHKNVEVPIAVEPNLGYTIQVLALKTKRLKNLNYFKGLDKAKIAELACSDGFYRYTYSLFDSLEESLLARQNIVSNSRFKDAFVRPVKQLKELKSEK